MSYSLFFKMGTKIYGVTIFIKKASITKFTIFILLSNTLSTFIVNSHLPFLVILRVKKQASKGLFYFQYYTCSYFMVSSYKSMYLLICFNPFSSILLIFALISSMYISFPFASLPDTR